VSLIEYLKPQFWGHRPQSGPYRSLFNFRRVWLLTIVLMAAVTLTPLATMAIIDYKITRNAVDSEARLRTTRTTSNARRVLSFYLNERLSALGLITRDNDYNDLRNPERLEELLGNLKQSFGGFVDLGVINNAGIQVSYVGPYLLQGKDYSGQEWFEQALSRGSYVSDVFLGFRRAPHLIMTVKHELEGGDFFLFRATLDTESFNELGRLDLLSGGDSFIINAEGVLQTPSRFYGEVLEKTGLPVPEYSEHTEVMTYETEDGRDLIIGYAYIEDSPFILMVVKEAHDLMGAWYKTRLELMGFLIASIALILLVVVGVATYYVDRIFVADQNRVAALHHIEHSNKMASIGRLAAGVAHEINNPLAVINEKAGLIKDLFTFKKEYQSDERLIGLIDSVLRSVERTGTITKHLLSFARHIDVSTDKINLPELIEEVLSFLQKEAEYRSIDIQVDMDPGVREFVSDRGKLQQILLNLVNNAFDAMSEGGTLQIKTRLAGKDILMLEVKDSGCGISEEYRKRIFEPFFSTKKKRGGTGLGLSITYGLVKEMGGSIEVRSKKGVGSVFIITLPINKEKQDKDN